MAGEGNALPHGPEPEPEPGGGSAPGGGPEPGGELRAGGPERGSDRVERDGSGEAPRPGVMEPSNRVEDERFMRRALELAAIGRQDGEVPVGAVVVVGGRVAGEGWNQPIGVARSDRACGDRGDQGCGAPCGQLPAGRRDAST